MDYDTTTLRRLQDKKKRGKILALSYRDLGDIDRAVRLEHCGDYLAFGTTSEGVTVLAEADFCRERLCPACTWRRSLKIYGNTSAAMDWVDAHYQVKWLFLTLTMRNCSGDDLASTLDTMSDGWKRLSNNRKWKQRVHAAMRTLEITINHDDDTYHPHYHIILGVKKSYATKSDDTYWDHDDWMAAWRQAARLPYDPSVRIERVKGKAKGIAEVSKYMAKDTDYIMPDDIDRQTEIVAVLHEALRGRRLVGYTGWLTEARRALKIEDEESGPLVDTIRGDLAGTLRRYKWSAGLGCYQPMEG